MNKAEQVGDQRPRASGLCLSAMRRPIASRRSSACKAIEDRGAPCWISARDVAPGDNYQEAIVKAIRHARAMVLVFSEAANKSEEIKKELSLASRHRVPVIALRIKNVDPSDAFAYELSTRQWIDAFEGWDRSIDSLVSRIGQLSGAEPIRRGHCFACPSPQSSLFPTPGGACRVRWLIGVDDGGRRLAVAPSEFDSRAQHDRPLGRV